MNYSYRILWWCDPNVFSIHFVKWLKRYAPKQLSEVVFRFPEVKEKLAPFYKSVL